jgi:hypothetical protein
MRMLQLSPKLDHAVQGVAALGDRILGLVVPRVTAEAACPCQGDFLQYCGCYSYGSDYRKYYRTCYFNCDCSHYCDSCIYSAYSC